MEILVLQDYEQIITTKHTSVKHIWTSISGLLYERIYHYGRRRQQVKTARWGGRGHLFVWRSLFQEKVDWARTLFLSKHPLRARTISHVHPWQWMWRICDAQLCSSTYFMMKCHKCWNVLFFFFLLRPLSLNLPGRLLLQLFPAFPEIASSEKSPGRAAFVECGNTDTCRARECDHSAVSLRHLVVLLQGRVMCFFFVEKLPSFYLVTLDFWLREAMPILAMFYHSRDKWKPLGVFHWFFRSRWAKLCHFFHYHFSCQVVSKMDLLWSGAKVWCRWADFVTFGQSHTYLS